MQDKCILKLIQLTKNYIININPIAIQRILFIIPFWIIKHLPTLHNLILYYHPCGSDTLPL